MFESGVRRSVGITLVALVVAGCATSTTSRPSPSSDTGARAPAGEGPTNFASPDNLLQRYPTMRHQQL